MNRYKKFCGKLILFGEYSIIKGSMALIVPYKKVQACLEQPEYFDNNSENSNQELEKFCNYLENNELFSKYLDVSAFRSELKNGLFFRSTIPSGYGAGSSGALVAAVYQGFGRNQNLDLKFLKDLFGKMESYFHGNSSGIDPLTCYLNKPVLITSDKNVVEGNFIQKTDNQVDIFLIDTQIKGKTNFLVESFLKRLEDQNFYADFSKNYIPVVNQCIEHFINAENKKLMDQIKLLSKWQFANMKPMIPDFLKPIFEDESTPFTLKICGSGGGGFILGFTQQKENTQTFLENANIKFEWLSFC